MRSKVDKEEAENFAKILTILWSEGGGNIEMFNKILGK